LTACRKAVREGSEKPTATRGVLNDTMTKADLRFPVHLLHQKAHVCFRSFTTGIQQGHDRHRRFGILLNDLPANGFKAAAAADGNMFVDSRRLVGVACLLLVWFGGME
jgi:hypothetical protein